jgi:ABC-type bacteriocin/lantibiotic exporter with double-glycine peptidase domain
MRLLMPPIAAITAFGALLPVMLLTLDASSTTSAFLMPSSASSSVFHGRSQSTVAGNMRLQLAASSAAAKKKKKNKKRESTDEVEEKTSTTALPPAISLDGLTCSHDGGTVYQLRDVSYNLPRTARVGLVGRNGWYELLNIKRFALLPYFLIISNPF